MGKNLHLIRLFYKAYKLRNNHYQNNMINAILSITIYRVSGADVYQLPITNYQSSMNK